MKYRQTMMQDKDVLADRVALKIGNRWIDGILLDGYGKVLPLPCKVYKGKTYVVEVDDSGYINQP